MSKQKEGFLKKAYDHVFAKDYAYALPKGEPILVRHDDSAHGYTIIVDTKLSKEVQKLIDEALALYFARPKKKLRDEDVWSVS